MFFFCYINPLAIFKYNIKHIANCNHDMEIYFFFLIKVICILFFSRIKIQTQANEKKNLIKTSQNNCIPLEKKNSNARKTGLD